MIKTKTFQRKKARKQEWVRGGGEAYRIVLAEQYSDSDRVSKWVYSSITAVFLCACIRQWHCSKGKYRNHVWGQEPLIQPCQIGQSNSASAFCYLTLLWVHYCFCSTFFSGCSLTVPSSWLCGIVFVGRSAPCTLFCTLPNVMTSWKCACLFFPSLCLLPVPLHQMCNLDIQKSVTQLICRIAFGFCLFWFFSLQQNFIFALPNYPSP